MEATLTKPSGGKLSELKDDIPPPTTGLAPYTGPWTESEVIHLLKRALFGAKRSDIAYFKTLTCAQAVDQLLTLPVEPPMQHLLMLPIQIPMFYKEIPG
jgi:hypothetical protein